MRDSVRYFKGIAVVVPMVLLAFATAVAADQNPNAVKGFNSNGVYQMNGLDSISAFNGNLTLTIPLGQVYPLGGGLSYQLRLYANGNIWDSAARPDLNDELEAIDQPDCRPPGTAAPEPCVHAFPDRRANAGIGWSVSLGRLLPPGEQTNGSSHYIYESPDGSEHHFFDTPHEDKGDDGNANVRYTRDGSYLRLSPGTNGRLKVEFPSGEVHTFAPPAITGLETWQLESIGSQYVPGALTVACTDIAATPRLRECVISDGFRSHTIDYREYDFESGMLEMLPDTDPPLITKRMLVDRVEVAAFASQTAAYQFTYDQAALQRPDWHTVDSYSPTLATVQRLRTLTLPDGRTYQFDYATAYPHAGLPTKAVLPTGGRVEWTYQAYQYPTWSGNRAAHMSQTFGVATRSVYRSASDTDPAVWSYTNELDAELSSIAPPPQELKVTVTDPSGSKVEHYFNVSSASHTSGHYGLPFTPKTTDATSPRFLSTRFIPAGGTATRATYVRYEVDPGTDGPSDRRNARQVSSRTIYLDDSNAYLDSDLSDYDGLGHYRTVTQSGTGVPTRVTTTAFNPSAGTYPGVWTIPSTTAPWLLETFASRTVTVGGRSSRSDHYFTPTGFLERTRMRKDVTGNAGANDVVVHFTADSSGNVAREEYYGGDGSTVPASGALKDLTLTGRQYRIDHQYAFGARKKSEYYSAANTPTGVVLLDADIDPNTGVPSQVRDSAGVATAYGFDTSGRVKSVRPTGRSWAEYEYGTTVPASITTRQCAASATNCVSTALTESRQYFDGLGRLQEQRQRIGSALWSATWTTYDKLGRITATTVPVNVPTGTSGAAPAGTAATAVVYDSYGRVLSSTLPDGITRTEFVYDGVRRKTRKRWIWTGQDGNGGQAGVQDVEVPVVEEYDLYGRLTAVVEKSGPTTAAAPVGGDVRTEYSYDVADRLVGVMMNRTAGSPDPSRPVQQRLFDYDGRGFLRWESHPESGISAYEYDARGHILSRNQGAAGTLFDLAYTYDAAERLVEMKGRNPLYGPDYPDQPQFRPIKQFQFATNNVWVTNESEDQTPRWSLSKGKLHIATRYNYADDPYSDPDIRVAHEYHYLDTAGRITRRVTRIDRSDYGSYTRLKKVTLDKTWNDLDQQATVTYPTCLNCGLPPETPARTITSNYEYGRLTSLSDFVSSITYSPNGLRNVLAHTNAIADTTTSTAAMARPSSIRFATYDKCLKPAITVQPAGGARNQITTLSVTVSGTGPFIYEWWSFENGLIVGETGSSYVLPPLSQTDQFWVVITGPCGAVTSNRAVVTVSSCVAPTTGSIDAMRLPDGSWKLQPHPTYRRSTGFPTFQWRRTSDNFLAGTSETLTIGAVTTATTYSLTITDACGTVTGSVTIAVAAQMPTTLAATRSGTTQITVTWPAVSGVSSYTVERRSGAGWEEVASVTGTTYVDTGLATGRTYAYRVSAGPGTGYSNSDVATTDTFTPAVALQPVSAVPMSDALDALNKVRGAAGWPPVTWSNILSPTDPLPIPGLLVFPRHVTACRARMNEALQALGALVTPYTDPDVTGLRIKAVHINEIQQRAY